jgi:hypothetical protein
MNDPKLKIRLSLTDAKKSAYKNGGCARKILQVRVNIRQFNCHEIWILRFIGFIMEGQVKKSMSQSLVAMTKSAKLSFAQKVDALENFLLCFFFDGVIRELL